MQLLTVKYISVIALDYKFLIMCKVYYAWYINIKAANYSIVSN